MRLKSMDIIARSHRSNRYAKSKGTQCKSHRRNVVRTMHGRQRHTHIYIYIKVNPYKTKNKRDL